MEKEEQLNYLKLQLRVAYMELSFCRMQWLHEAARECSVEKPRFGFEEEFSLSSVWNVLDLQRLGICEYDEMGELEEGIKTCAESFMLHYLEKDFNYDKSLTEDQIWKKIKKLEKEIKELEEKENGKK